MMDANSVQKPSGTQELRKHHMTPMGIAFMLFCLVAAGAFGIEEMIPLSGPGLTLVILAVFPIIWALPICLIVSELTAFMPAEGGLYVWAKDALGEFWGFLMGWWIFLAIYMYNAIFVVLVVGYTEKFIPMTDMQSMVLKVGMVLFFTIVNLLGLKEVSFLSAIFSILILAVFALVTVVGFANWNYNPMVPFTPEGQSVVDSLGGSICVAIWMYCGYETISNMGGEISNPKVIPKGFMIAMPLIALSYLLPTLAGIVSVGNWESWSTEGGEGTVGYADVLTQNLGPIWGVIFIIVAIISQCAMFNAYIAGGSRVVFVMSADNFCPKFLTKISKKRGVPYWPIILMAVITMVMMFFDYTALLTALTPLTVVMYMFLAVILVRFRKKYPVEKRDKDVYHIRGGKVSLIYIVAMPFLVGILGLLVNGTEYFLLGFATIVSGIFAYVILKLGYGGLHKNDPENNPINPKTKLAVGDIMRFGIFIVIFGVYACLGSFFLEWYEGSWGPEYYLDMYGSGLQSNFALMISLARYGGIIATAAGACLIYIGRKFDKPIGA